MKRIVLIEDDIDIRRLVADARAEEGYDVETAENGLLGLELAINRDPDLVLMDLGLPDVDGSDLLPMIRAVSDVPVIVLTARGADQTVVATLDAGADDYLTKPFSVAQLSARVRAVLRRGAESSGDGRIVVGDLVIEPTSREASLNGKILDLAPKEFDLLALLAGRPGEVISKREILAEVWRE